MIAKHVQRMCRSLGFNVTRLPGNRFDAMTEVLTRLARAGLAPTVIVDVGANAGQWASKVSMVFPSVPLHVIEPQAACRPALEALRARRDGVEVHSVLVSRPGARELMMAAAGAGSTGAHVVRNAGARADLTSVPATTLDELLALRIGANERVLLKLDVEGHELDVLSGSQQLLSRVDAIVSEVQFYDIDRAGNPVFAEYVATLDRLGFLLYDIAGLSGRRRDGRLTVGDAVFVRRSSPLAADNSWE
jgi:FkbM family methyltransferase